MVVSKPTLRLDSDNWCSASDGVPATTDVSRSKALHSLTGNSSIISTFKQDLKKLMFFTQRKDSSHHQATQFSHTAVLHKLSIVQVLSHSKFRKNNTTRQKKPVLQSPKVDFLQAFFFAIQPRAFK